MRDDSGACGWCVPPVRAVFCPEGFTNETHSMLLFCHEFEGNAATFNALTGEVKQGAQEALYETRGTRLISDSPLDGARCTRALTKCYPLSNRLSFPA